MILKGKHGWRVSLGGHVHELFLLAVLGQNIGRLEEETVKVFVLFYPGREEVSNFWERS